MLDRSANLRLIITGRGNSTDFTRGWRKSYKKLAHKRMRMAAQKEIADQMDDICFELVERSQDMDGGYWCGNSEEYCGTTVDLAELDPVELLEPDTFDLKELLDEMETVRQRKLARRRELYRKRKARKQVARYLELVSELKKLEGKLEREAFDELSLRGELV